jgi:hypothetical protein
MSQTRTLRARSAQYRTAIGWVTIGTLIILLLKHFGAYAVRPIEGQRVLVSLIMLAPQVCYLYGCWSLRPAFAALAEGRMFGEELSRALATLGWSLIAGSIYNVFFLTNLMRAVLETRGSLLNFQLSDIVLGVVGGALVLLSALMTKARAMRTELDHII